MRRVSALCVRCTGACVVHVRALYECVRVRACACRVRERAWYLPGACVRVPWSVRVRACVCVRVRVL